MADLRTLSTIRPFVADVGFCIYCKHTNTTNLKREHVIPHSLGGGIILRFASCQFHEKMTRHFESEIAGGSWGAFRNVRGLPSYNKKKRPTHLPLEVKDDEGEGVRQVAASQYPDFFPIPAFEGLPGLMSGAQPSPPHTTLRIYHNKTDAVRKAEALNVKEISVSGKIHIASFIRLTAKIAHGYAITHFGFEFHPLLLEIIEGDVSRSGHYIGATHKQFERPAQPNRHIMGHEIIPAGRHSFILVSVGLFAGLGAPVHTAIAGVFDTEQPPSAPPWLRTDKSIVSAQ